MLSEEMQVVAYDMMESIKEKVAQSVTCSLIDSGEPLERVAVMESVSEFAREHGMNHELQSILKFEMQSAMPYVLLSYLRQSGALSEVVIKFGMENGIDSFMPILTACVDNSMNLGMLTLVEYARNPQNYPELDQSVTFVMQYVINSVIDSIIEEVKQHSGSMPSQYSTGSS